MNFSNYGHFAQGEALPKTRQNIKTPMQRTVITRTSARCVSDVIMAANGNWREILCLLGVNIPTNKKHGPCPICGGKDRFRFDDKDKRGTWICNQCGAGDGLNLVCKTKSISAKEAAKEISSLMNWLPEALPPAQRQMMLQKNEKLKMEVKSATSTNHKNAALRAKKIIANSTQDTPLYLINKGLASCICAVNTNSITIGGIEFPSGSALVPLQNSSGEIINLQAIRSDGLKRYLFGGQKQHAYHLIKGEELIAIVEGFATGLSVHQATQATVYCAMDAGNLLPVAKIVRQQYPDAIILLCADNDAKTNGNPGKTKAKQAATEINGLIAIPIISGDWNDYYQIYGQTKTQDEIMNNIKGHNHGHK